MEIRAATISDAYSIAEVQVAGWQAAYRGIMPDSVLDGLSVPKREEMLAANPRRIEVPVACRRA